MLGTYFKKHEKIALKYVDISHRITKGNTSGINLYHTCNRRDGQKVIYLMATNSPESEYFL